jgi:L-fucose isomerase-like protein
MNVNGGKVMADTFHYVPLASALHNEAGLARLVAEFERTLTPAGGVRDDDVSSTEPLVYLVLTGGTERRLLELAVRRDTFVPAEPVLLVAHPWQNSLPAAMEALARLQQIGRRGRIVYLDPDGAGGSAEIVQAVNDLEVWHTLHRFRIGLVGEPSDWLVASSPSAAVVRETWGPEVVPIDIDRAIASYESPSTARVPSSAVLVALSVQRGARFDDGIPTDGLGPAARLYPVLNDLIRDERLDAISVRCFDLISALHTTSCVALAELNDEGVIAGCEGDLVSAVAMIWIQHLVGTLPWMANPVQIDRARDVVRIAHCTVPRSLADSYGLTTHFESSQGVGIQGHVLPGDVTLVRIGGSRMEKLWVADGEALPTVPLPNLCRTQLDVRVAPESLGQLLSTLWGTISWPSEAITRAGWSPGGGPWSRRSRRPRPR